MIGHRGAPALLLVLTAMLGAHGAGAAPFDGGPKILLHVASMSSKNACQAGALTDCALAATSGTLTVPGAGPYYYVYVIAARGSLNGVGELQVGIKYEHDSAGDYLDGSGIDMLAWTLCASSQSFSGPNVWPQPGSGVLIRWTSGGSCATTETAVAGYFYLAAFTPDALLLKPRPTDGVARIVDCSGQPHDLVEGDLGFARFGGSNPSGCNPCLKLCVPPDPVAATTWGGIKALFR